MKTKVRELVNSPCGDIIEELCSLQREELLKVSRGLDVIQNMLTDIVAMPTTCDGECEGK